MSCLPERLKLCRIGLNKSQAEMAKYINVSRQAYTTYESGTRKPDVDTLSLLADYFNVTTDYLLGRTDTPTFYRHDISVPGVDEAYVLSKEKEPPTPQEREQLESEAEAKIEAGQTLRLNPDELPRNRQELEQVIRQMIADSLHREKE